MRGLVLAFVLALVCVTPALGSDIGRKHQIDTRISSLKDRLQAQKQRERALRSEVSGYTDRIRALEAKVGDVSLRLNTLETDLALHEGRLNALNALFTLQSTRLEFLRRQYGKSVGALNRRLVEIYESPPASTLDVVLGARSIQDALDQVQYMNEIGEQDRRIAAQVRYAKLQVTAARAKTKKLRATVQGETAIISARTAQTRSVKNELVGAASDLSATKNAKLTDLSKLTADEQAAASEIDALQAASNDIAARIRAAQAQHSTSSSGAPAVPSSAGLIWPVSGPITSPFGWRWGRMHEGIDIGVPSGTPIEAAASGTVIYCGWESGYGNLTVIDHGGNLATAYGHQSSIAVGCGQQVAQGQVIGYVGCTGHCFGPHLHFEVRIGGNAVDPLGYL